MRTLHAALAALAIAFVLIVITGNRECAPKYYQRGDVVAGLGVALLFAVLLLWAASGDSDRRRSIGALSSAGLAALFFSTASIPMLVSPIAVVGALRLPRPPTARWRTVALMPVVVVVTVGLLYLGQSGMTPEQFRCP